MWKRSDYAQSPEAASEQFPMITAALGFHTLHCCSYMSMAEVWASPLPSESFLFLLNALYTRQRKYTGAKHDVAIFPQSMNKIIVSLQLCLWFSTLAMRAKGRQSNCQYLHQCKNSWGHTILPLSSDSNFHTPLKCIINLTNTLNECWYAHLGWCLYLGSVDPCQTWWSWWPPDDVAQEQEFGVGST